MFGARASCGSHFDFAEGRKRASLCSTHSLSGGSKRRLQNGNFLLGNKETKRMPEHLTPAHAHHHPWKTTPDLPHPPSSELLVWGSDSECGILSFLDLCCCFQDTREEGSEGRERKGRRGEAMGGEGEEEGRAGIAPPGLQRFPIKAACLFLFPLWTLVSESPFAQVIIPAGWRNLFSRNMQSR